MGDIIVVRPRSALARRIECERVHDGSVEARESTAEIGGVALRVTQVLNLSQVASKYIAETEKNLREVFERAERSDAVIVYDEADELFGSRASGDAAPCVRLSAADFATVLRARLTP
ncbi:AAA family ATPase [Microbacterium sp. SLBN-146]|uniref:AAA family ATPase n=1 Tax=Microbacterium sp. SLBN-146 TaxID=2768457 RepID=UPI001C930CE9|nr:AAA family ATPase [Microbacterium sp. SLBN-146]